MNADRLLEHYNRIADAPDTIARLRRFILDLAVRGKLVPQDPNDEPASELLKRIAKEKAQLGIKSVLSQLEAVEIPFELPAGWSWSRIGEVCSKTGSGSTPRGGKEVYKDTGIPFLRSQNVYDDGLRLNDVAYIDLETHERMGGTRVLPGDLLLNITGGSMGRCCRIPDSFDAANVSQHVAIIRMTLKGMEDFLHLLVLSPYFQAFIFDEQTGAGRGGLPKNRMDQIAVALPPLAEQYRIVAKVDELMTLCDRLEAARAGREARRDRLAVASLARLNAPDPETFQADARFALDALPALTTRPDQIRQLRQTILNLAVRGKLVPQVATDEPAAELLKRIAKEKSRAGKREKVEAEIDNEEELGELSPTWRAVPLIALGSWAIGSGFPKNEQGLETGPHFFLKVSDMNLPGNEKYITTSNNFIDDDAARRMRAKVHPPGTIIFPKIGGAIATNKRRILTKGSAIDNNCLGITFASELNVEWAFLLLTTLDLTRYQAGTAVPALQQGVLERIPVGLPPLAEQHRIVAKVNELMALCDRLEASLTAAAATRRRLLDALVAEALAPADGREREAAE